MGKNVAMRFINRILEIPVVWNLSQFVLGSNSNKQRLYRSFFTQKGKLLDFGCANGNTFDAFKDFDYCGVDIDSKFINYARHKYKRFENAQWVAADILKNPFEPDTFDYVLFAGTGHHIPESMLAPVLQSLIRMVKKNGRIYVIDHISRPGDTWWIKMLIKFDQGQFTRTEAQYNEIFNGFKDQATVISTSIRKMSGNFFPLPDFFIAILEKK